MLQQASATILNGQ